MVRIANPVAVEAETPLGPSQQSKRLPWYIIAASAVTAVLITLAVLTVTVRSTDGFAVWSDGLVYFLYARSGVVDRDLDITDEFNYLNARIPPGSRAMEPLRKWTIHRADGTVQAPWPVGAGLILTPFYAVGYGLESVVAKLSGRAADSYGLIPQCAFVLGSVAFGVVGFWCLVLLCREVTSDQFSYLASLGVVLCGPGVFYVLVHPSMAHASSFGLIAGLTLIWLRSWTRGSTAYTLLALGLVLGVATTVRYQNALFGILPGALVLKEWRQAGFVWAARRAVIAGMAFMLPVALLLHGQLRVSAVPAQTALSVAQYPIDLTSPYFWDVLFSCRHGAFYWAPVLGMSLAGLVWASLNGNRWPAALLVAFAAHVYLIGGLGLSNIAYGGHQPAPGWLHHWDDAPSFGMRYLTECAPVFALGLACLMKAARRHVGPTGWTAILAPFVLWNVLLILAYGLETITRSGCLPYKDMFSGFAVALHRLLQHWV